MEFIIEAIIEGIMFAIFCVPGAGLRWLYHRGKIPFRVLIKEDNTYNGGIFILFLSFIFVILFLTVVQ